MGLKDFFGKAWNGMKTAGNWVGDKVKKGVGFVGRIAKPILSLSRMIPGKIGAISTVAHGVLDGISGLVGALPDSKAKQKINDFAMNGKDILNGGVDIANDIADKTNKFVENAVPIIEKADNALNPRDVRSLGSRQRTIQIKPAVM